MIFIGHNSYTKHPCYDRASPNHQSPAQRKRQCRSSIRYGGAWTNGFTVNMPIQAWVWNHANCVLSLAEHHTQRSTAHSLHSELEEGNVSVLGTEKVFQLLSVSAIWCHTFLTRLTLRAGDKLWNQLSLHMLKGPEGTHKLQHYHIKACLTISLSHTISISSFVRVISPLFFLSVSLSLTLYSMYLPICFLCRHTHRHILHNWTQTTDMLH